MLLITGATGQLGSATVNYLLNNNVPASEIAVLVRDEAKAEELKNKGVNIRIGNYTDYSSLLAAMKGIDKVLLISSNDMNDRSGQHKNVVAAAKEAGARYIVYTSFERVNETETSPIFFIANSHVETEKAIKESGLAYTILRNTLYADIIPMFVGDAVQQQAVVLPAGTAKTSFATRDNMAEAIANILSSEGHEQKEYSITNAEAYSMQDIADTISNITNTPIKYVSPSTEEYVNGAIANGAPEEIAQMVAGFSAAIAQGEFEHTSNQLEQLLGRKPTTLSEYLTTVYS